MVSLSVGLCPDWETWDTVKPAENASEAMQLADDWLGIPQVSRRGYRFVERCECDVSLASFGLSAHLILTVIFKQTKVQFTFCFLFCLSYARCEGGNGCMNQVSLLYLPFRRLPC